ncbi:hypothetical protein [Fodinicurvata halophila]|uniref:hypothetical protein n=1 Tax=Fodinicurvata halophila TaxID=1419723 RepID=UPI0036356B93
MGQPQWQDFLEKTGFAASPTKNVIGHNLFDFITGAEVRSSYQRLHESVWHGQGQKLSFQYRCDGPSVKREMRMSMSHLSLDGIGGAVLYQSQLLSEVARPPLNLLDPDLILGVMANERNFPIVALCSYCQKVAWPLSEHREDAREWITPEDYYARGGHSDVRVSHGICPSCVGMLEMA